jgi:hypothetical protein
MNGEVKMGQPVLHSDINAVARRDGWWSWHERNGVCSRSKCTCMHIGFTRLSGQRSILQPSGRCRPENTLHGINPRYQLYNMRTPAYIANPLSPNMDTTRLALSNFYLRPVISLVDPDLKYWASYSLVPTCLRRRVNTACRGRYSVILEAVTGFGQLWVQASISNPSTRCSLTMAGNWVSVFRVED